MLIVRSLQAETDRITKLDADALTEYIGAIDPHDLVLLWNSIADDILKRRLLEELDPEIVSSALKWLDYDSRSKSLKYMPNVQRQRIVGKWPERSKKLELAMLDRWQIIQDLHWDDGIADVRVKTRRSLPEHYPPAMNRCALCEEPYLLWDSITIVHCRKHSHCEACNIEEGHCRHSDCEIH